MKNVLIIYNFYFSKDFHTTYIVLNNNHIMHLLRIGNFFKFIGNKREYQHELYHELPDTKENNTYCSAPLLNVPFVSS
jgi:hypothetical protein